MLTRRDVLKTAAVGTPMLLAAGSINLQSDTGKTSPSPSTTPWTRTLRQPNPPTKLNAREASPAQKDLAWDIYDEGISAEGAEASEDCHCVNADITANGVWPRIIPEQDANAFKPFLDETPRGTTLPNPNVDYYQIAIVEVPNVVILDGFKTRIWTYKDFPSAVTPYAPTTSSADEFPGPTFFANRNRPVIIRFVSYLSKDSVLGHGAQPDTAIHGHGFHTPPQSDGYPTDCILAWKGPGSLPDSRVYAHPNDNDFPGTLWYHDHANHHTARNVYCGLAGFYILRPYPKPEEGVEDPNDTARDAFFRKIEGCLPSGAYDVAMVFQDRLFDQEGQLFFDQFAHDGRLGDTFLVNGRVKPKLKVEPRKYRLRWLNGSNARFYTLAFSTSKTSIDGENPLRFVQIGTEGALLPRPVVRTRAEIANAERLEVVFDFSQFANQQVFLVNCLQQPDGRGPDQVDLNNCTPLVRFDVGATGDDESCIPPILNPELVRNAAGDWAYPGYSESDVEIDPATGKPKERLFVFDRSHGMWTVNGQIFDAHRNDTVAGVPLSKDFDPPDEVCIIADPVPLAAVFEGDTSSIVGVPSLCTDASADGCAADVPTCATSGATTSTVKPEIWRVENKSGGWAHPVHVHLEQFKLLSREDSGGGELIPLQPHELGMKDVFVLHENETIRFITTFKDHNNHFDNTEGVLQDYVFHCHNIDHEDMEMMATKRLVCPGDELPADPSPSDECELAGEEN
jgi:FtsP/CotA-like multicopper oxidase with cupredoxin domain